MIDYIIVLVRWSYVPSGRATTRNVPSEARRILMGPIATGPKKRYPWILDGLEEYIEPYMFALIKPKEHKKGRGRVGTAGGGIGIFKTKRKIGETHLKKIVDRLTDFCDEWKSGGKYGNKINSYQIVVSDLLVYR